MGKPYKHRRYHQGCGVCAYLNMVKGANIDPSWIDFALYRTDDSAELRRGFVRYLEREWRNYHYYLDFSLRVLGRGI